MDTGGFRGSGTCRSGKLVDFRRKWGCQEVPRDTSDGGVFGARNGVRQAGGGVEGRACRHVEQKRALVLKSVRDSTGPCEISPAVRLSLGCTYDGLQVHRKNGDAFVAWMKAIIDDYVRDRKVLEPMIDVVCPMQLLTADDYYMKVELTCF